MTDCPLFFGIHSVVQMFPFVFDRKHSPISKLAKEVWIKPIC